MASKKEKRKPKSMDLASIEIPAYRPEGEVLADLEEVCCRPGFAHTLAYLCWRENFFGYDEKLLPEDLSHFSNEEQLVRSEVSLLARLMVSAPLDLTLPPPSETQRQIDDVESLLKELHHTLSIPMFERLSGTMQGESLSDASSTHGKTYREPIFYAAEAAYDFQYWDFAAQRYRDDGDWLLAEHGYAPTDVPAFCRAVSTLQTNEITRLRSSFTPEALDDLSLLSAFRFTPQQIAGVCCVPIERVRSLVTAFSLEELPLEGRYSEIGAWNQLSSYPIILLNDGSFLLFQLYSLAESSYETPFFWMQQDRDYKNAAAKNRGRFTERLSANRLASVFGTAHVHQNVTLYDKRGKTAGEIDVLVTLGDRAIVLQAKSKKLTEAARKGSDEAIQRDLQKAVQDAYDQGFACAQHLLAKDCQLRDGQDAPLEITRDFTEVFLLCVVADYFPGLPHFTDEFVSLHEHDVIRSPYIIDVFFLDVACELLESPLYFLSFLNRRAKFARTVQSVSEYAVLGFHLSQNLWFKDNLDRVDLGQEFSAPVDAAMLGRRAGVPADQVPSGILTNFNGTLFGSLIQQIGELREGRVLDLGFLLLEASSETAEQVSQAIDAIFSRANASGGVHDFSIALKNSGVTLHCGFSSATKIRERLEAHCKLAKYRSKAATWFGIALSPVNRGEMVLAMGLHDPWVYDLGMDRAVRAFGTKGSRKLKIESPGQRRRQKIGVNEPCPCGSGKKYKKCCRDSDAFGAER